METWVLPKRSETVINTSTMEQVCLLMFADDLETAARHSPRHDGEIVLGGIKQMCGGYVIVGRARGGNFYDISRDGMIHQVTEHFIKRTFKCMDLRPLHKTPKDRTRRVNEQARTKFQEVRDFLLGIPPTTDNQ